MRAGAALLVAAQTLTGCAAPLSHDGALTVVPYELEPTGRIVVDVRLNGRGPFRFAIDTAATGSFVLTRVRETLALEPVPGIEATVYGAVASGRFPVVTVDRLEIGTAVLRGARLIALPAGTIATTTIDGVLGADFLRRYTAGFTARERALRLYPPAVLDARSYHGWASISLEPRAFGNSEEPLHFLTITIAKRSIPALLDLGAGVSVLNTPAARALRLSPVRAGETGEFAGALGSEPVVARLGTQDLQTGGVGWRNESFLIADPEIFTTLGYAGRPLAILGSGLFNQRDFIIDFARERLLVRSSMRETDVR